MEEIEQHDLLFRLPSQQCEALHGKIIPARVNRLFRLYTRCQTMLRNQGYMIPEFYVYPTLFEFWCRFGNDKHTKKELTMLLRHMHDPDKQLVCFFPERQPHQEMFQMFVDHCKHLKAGNALIIFPYNKLVSSTAQNHMNRADIAFQAFTENELLFSPVEHELTSDIRMLEPDERDALLKHYGITTNNLQRLRHDEALARHFNFPKNAVIAMKRPDDANGYRIQYLCVK